MTLDHFPQGPQDASYAPLVKGDRVATPMYEDPAIFDVEMEKIFGKTWVWVGHESEVPDKGNFKLSVVGTQPVIISHDRKGALHVLVNRCRHRAATVCEIKKGKTSSFQCPYHGWGYALDGSLRGVPYTEGYNTDFDKKDYGLKKLKVETYQGMIFASFNMDVEPLEDFLGNAKPWIDLFMKQGGGFPVKTLGEHQFKVPMNWKIQLENTTDAYHFPVVHKSFMQSLDGEATQQFSFLEDDDGWVEDLGNGHSVMVMMPELNDLDDNLDAPIPERFQALAETLRADYDEDQVRRIVRAVGGCGFNLNLFPNAACSLSFFRILRPVSVNETEIRHIALGMDGGPEAANQMRMRLHEHFQGPMGFGSPDDAEVWERVQRGSAGGGDLDVMVNRGKGLEETSENGLPKGDISAETGMRAAYAKWQEMMA
ncbi:aromatic ring-hydroxylating dioxygenase subunit alpha [Pseudooceanicola sediminis]|uniref:Aromatic ring-hydroxylating dioxygenase subunit alpha n=1 Tax=Pseudooceanicola sediminis TaxID=2211117 RepID=A0A399J0G8_9RHOB|nr:aromatic ring-hydroxylating dioxygenase subunit alpha [Pseudooceanicola sediminis]KAA2313948.1 Rieske 2Fe-2S domain-containing protein [Puniceibacterium sp. HSS470]RII38761.1 aromatic ring-hydroxylating dioxygenase subunit alpha [Pseudooceanicola sediminis]|tara:strand:+ start:76201 stop:77478 length:1278 start_codon:yes stop_codon:yes gene_type:complete